ncbi:hypothetical protein C4559_03915 [Candidatus Microgenomates bacterium]|nr:MAG: hypothetical protein C4559_03915 [Candidatus Microgenomates bacterium]
MKLSNIFNRLIEYSFYSLFLLVPLVFTSETSELFEFNKMWLTFGLTIVIGFAWFAKMVLRKRFFIQRTPLDIPIFLFLLSQIISTIFSIDTHVSIWGYYSRFNGGLLSIISYIFLYYAFVSNFLARGGTDGRAPDSAQALFGTNTSRALAGGKSVTGPRAETMVKRLISISLISGLIVILWGLPSHFGYDPTCLIFRGTLDVSCWTDAFQPKVRIFSTLGQPDWLAAYLAVLIPIAIFLFIKNLKIQTTEKKNQVASFKYYVFKKEFILATFYILLTSLFYLALLYTDARSGFLAIWIALISFILFYFWMEKIKISEIIKKSFLWKYWNVLAVFVVLLCITFFIGSPIGQLDKLTFNGIKNSFETKTETAKPIAGEMGGTDSSKIRLIVWKGAIDAWKANPIFGTGVETFAFAYYKYRPIEHNMLSEWDYLYNKAHNEYLNYLTTTGLFGLGTYISMIGWFLFVTIKKFKIQNSKFKIESNNSKVNKEKFLLLNCTFDFCLLTFALLSSYLSILVTNFFGFSVVIMNLYLFLIPAFVFVLGGVINPDRVFIFPRNEEIFKSVSSVKYKVSSIQWIIIGFIILSTFYLILKLLSFYQADKLYGLGHNYYRVGQYQEAYAKLHEAVLARGDEPAFKDDLAVNDAILAMAYASQKEASTSAILAKEASDITDEITAEYPNNVVFAKSKVRVYYALAQADPQYFPKAMEAIIKASELAPTDAKVLYNLGLLYQQSGEVKKAIEILEKTVKYKPNYRDAYYALGLYYHDLGSDKNGKVIDSELHKKAVEIMKYLLNQNSTDQQATAALKNWGEL